MPSTIQTSGLGSQSLSALLHQTLKATRPNAIGMAIAYVSRYGFDFALELLSDHRVQHVRLVADTHDAITHTLQLSRGRWMPSGRSVP